MTKETEIVILETLAKILSLVSKGFGRYMYENEQNTIQQQIEKVKKEKN